MTDIVIRNIEPDVVERIDTIAAKAGLSRSDFLRQMLEQEVAKLKLAATMHDLHKFTRLGRKELMHKAWS